MREGGWTGLPSRGGSSPELTWPARGWGCGCPGGCWPLLASGHTPVDLKGFLASACSSELPAGSPLRLSLSLIGTGRAGPSPGRALGTGSTLPVSRGLQWDPAFVLSEQRKQVKRTCGHCGPSSLPLVQSGGAHVQDSPPAQVPLASPACWDEVVPGS